MTSKHSQQRSFFGHSRALITLSSMELWERFSFYGTQGILLIYLYRSITEGGLGIPQSTALGLLGAYGSAVYLSTILGAWFADRVLGNERTVFYSGVIVMLGHISLAVLPSVAGLAAGLTLVAVGSGGVKSSCGAIVGALYKHDHGRRDSAFSLFYLAVNVGGMAGPAITGLLQQQAGFHYAFGAAAVGMALGLIVYSRGRKRLPDSERHAPSPLSSREKRVFSLSAIVVIAVIALLLATGTLTASRLGPLLFVVIAIVVLAYFVVMLTSKKVSTDERKHVVVFIPIFLASAVFWALYVQSFGVFIAFFDQRVDRALFGWEMPVGWYNSMESLMAIVLAGSFAALWARLGDRQPSSAAKFVIALLLIAASFIAYYPYLGQNHQQMPLIAQLIQLFVFTCAEICLAPIGMSLAIKLAPEAFKSQMLAIFYLSLAFGIAGGGVLGSHYSEQQEVVWFLGMAAFGALAAILLWCAVPWIRRVAPQAC
ncbi:peptide MFS transporter [Carnimonas bestiolae]|uniref:peptide MFS transporter n=1 Tax=Carnimonas bestiolae TaxID=3402172 RepID=UPI003EDBB694